MNSLQMHNGYCYSTNLNGIPDVFLTVQLWPEVVPTHVGLKYNCP